MMLLFGITLRSAMCSSLQKFIVRLPGDLHNQLKHIAKRENRSMNNEIVDRLEKSLVVDETREMNEKLISLLLRKVDSMEERIKYLQMGHPEPEQDCPRPCYART
ncbi:MULTISPECIES: Arc family DNA-binding protein [Pseudomonas]|uniref:Arc family DNA-binding protein n=1 Tax=Pseudomonas TaxID=286 RepID=UPI00286EA734|nr:MULTISPECIES: Arc family DNA-binding protein [Pseudomonas]